MNSEQVGLESLAEAGERLCRPDVSRELVPPPRCRTEKSWVLAERCLPVLSEGDTSHPAKVVERSARTGALGLTNVWRSVRASSTDSLRGQYQ